MPHYAQNPGLFPMHGGCPCGHTRYALALAPLIVHCCYCLACQRQQGAALALNAVVESSALSLLPPLAHDDNKDPSGAPLAFLPYIARQLGACNATLDNRSPPSSSFSSPAASPPSPSAPAAPDKSTLLVTAEPSPSGYGHFTIRCPKCRAGVWGHYADGPAVTYLRVGTLDHATEVQPDVHIFTRTKHDFVAIADGKPQFDAYYPDRAAFYRDDGSRERVEALQPAVKQWRESLKAAAQESSA